MYVFSRVDSSNSLWTVEAWIISFASGVTRNSGAVDEYPSRIFPPFPYFLSFTVPPSSPSHSPSFTSFPSLPFSPPWRVDCVYLLRMSPLLRSFSTMDLCVSWIGQLDFELSAMLVYTSPNCETVRAWNRHDVRPAQAVRTARLFLAWGSQPVSVHLRIPYRGRWKRRNGKRGTVKNTGVEKAGLENAGTNRTGSKRRTAKRGIKSHRLKCRTGKCGTKFHRGGKSRTTVYGTQTG